MKIFSLLPVISLLAVANYSSIKSSGIVRADTTIVTHVLDGHIAEWPGEKFATDKATKIRYAIDNDSQVLFVALNISDKMAQQKIMQKGLHLFVDIKGKKKENHGVEFPLGMEKNPNIELMRVFGFASESLTQNIKTAGTINIALAWDTAYVLSIEYNIPLSILDGSMEELNNKKISIGWKINEDEQGPPAQPVSSTSRLVGVPAGSRPPGNRSGATNRNESFAQPSASKTQSSWGAHTIIF